MKVLKYPLAGHQQYRQLLLLYAHLSLSRPDYLLRYISWRYPKRRRY